MNSTAPGIRNGDDISLVDSSKTDSQELPFMQEMSHHNHENVLFLFAPIVILFTVFCLSAIVYIVASRRRRRYYEREGTVPRYQMEFEREQLLEEEEWDQECEKLISGRTEYEKKQHYQSYNNNNFELYT